MTKVNQNYSCAKCGHSEHEVGELRASGGGFMAILDIEDAIYTTVSCTRCGHTDLFKTSEESFLGMVADALFT